MNRLLHVAVAVAVGLANLTAPAVHAADTLTVTSWGGSYGDSQRKAYFEPFTAATGITVLADEWRGDIARIRAAAAVLEPGDVLIADANTGWTQHAAVRVADAVRDVDVYLEQPCRSYAECLAVRRHTNRPFVLDEVIDGLDMVVRAAGDQAMDVINLKISKVGGLTRARQVRDLCVALGIAMTIEDTWGGDITTAAIAHLAHSTPERLLFTTTDFNSYVTVSIAEGAPQRRHGQRLRIRRLAAAAPWAQDHRHRRRTGRRGANYCLHCIGPGDE